MPRPRPGKPRLYSSVLRRWDWCALQRDIATNQRFCQSAPPSRGRNTRLCITGGYISSNRNCNRRKKKRQVSIQEKVGKGSESAFSCQSPTSHGVFLVWAQHPSATRMYLGDRAVQSVHDDGEDGKRRSESRAVGRVVTQDSGSDQPRFN